MILINKNKIKNKKAQFFIFSGFFLILSVLFIYYLETDNIYISKNSKNDILDNIIFETCMVAKSSNGTYIQDRLTAFSGNVSSYCSTFGNSCVLTIVNNTAIPSNESLINYTLFDYSINYNFENYTYVGSFTC